MGLNVPDDRKRDLISWFRTHVPYWQADPAKFGLSEEQVHAVWEALERASGDFDAAIQARAAAVTATAAQNNSLAALSTLGRAAVNTIKGNIAFSGDSGLWSEAGLSPPDPRGHGLTPTAPFNVTYSIRMGNAVQLTWKARQPRGVSNVIYDIRRSLDGGAFHHIGGSGKKRFTDTTVPFGTRSAVYTIRALRGGRESEQTMGLVVDFGSAALMGTQEATRRAA